jgi:hypothetical protein
MVSRDTKTDEVEMVQPAGVRAVFGFLCKEADRGVLCHINSYSDAPGYPLSHVIRYFESTLYIPYCTFSIARPSFCKVPNN